MTNQPPFRSDDATPDDAPEIDLLVGRLVDGEATDSDLERFSAAASRGSDAWRLFGEMQREHARLASIVGARLHAAQSVALPRHSRDGGVIHVIRRVQSYVAWAAVIALALVVGLTGSGDLPRARIVNLDSVDAGPPRTSTELDPVLLRTFERLPDGRYRIRWMRRIIEEVDVDDFDEALDMKTIDGSELLPNQ